jgi:hypothetical protein
VQLSDLSNESESVRQLVLKLLGDKAVAKLVKSAGRKKRPVLKMYVISDNPIVYDSYYTGLGKVRKGWKPKDPNSFSGV